MSVVGIVEIKGSTVLSSTAGLNPQPQLNLHITYMLGLFVCFVLLCFQHFKFGILFFKFFTSISVPRNNKDKMNHLQVNEVVTTRNNKNYRIM